MLTTDMSPSRALDVVVDGRPLRLLVKQPRRHVLRRARNVYDAALRKALAAGAPPKAQVPHIIQERGWLDDSQQARLDVLTTALEDGERMLSLPDLPADEAAQIATDLRQTRNDLLALLAPVHEFENSTAEALAEQQRFDFLVVSCTVFAKSGKPYFKSVSDYYARQADPVTLPACKLMADIAYGLTRLPEERILSDN